MLQNNNYNRPTRNQNTNRQSTSNKRVNPRGTNIHQSNASNHNPNHSSNGAQKRPAAQNVKAPAVQVPQQPSALSRGLAWFKRTYKVDKEILESHDVVCEKGSIDYVFLIIVLILLAFGTVMVFSASYAYSNTKYDDSYYIIFRHLMFAIVGLIAMTIVANLPFGLYKRLSVIAFIFCAILMITVFIPGLGVVRGGARRWINIGFTDLQPSEFMKLGLVMMLAWYFDRYYERITDKTNKIRASFFGVATPLAITAIACVLVLIQRHLSGTIIMFLIGIIVIFASGTGLKILIWLGSAGTLGLALFSIFTDYTKRRIEIWLNPEKDPLDAGYQTLQGLYAIGSGGLFGEGLGESYQKHNFVSQPQNDFIFTIICEELGFIGALAVILLFILFVWRGFLIAMRAPTIYTSLLVMGIIGKVAVQSVLNIAVVTNTIPNTGISLPFFSYGGSSLIVLLIEMGIVLSVSTLSAHDR